MRSPTKSVLTDWMWAPEYAADTMKCGQRCAAAWQARHVRDLQEEERDAGNLQWGELMRLNMARPHDRSHLLDQHHVENSPSMVGDVDEADQEGRVFDL